MARNTSKPTPQSPSPNWAPRCCSFEPLSPSPHNSASPLI
jgi:hypothetical protein